MLIENNLNSTNTFFIWKKNGSKQSFEVSELNPLINRVDGLVCFQLKFLSHEELQQRMSNLDSEMEREIYELRRRYQAKRQPIIDAIDQKKKRQQNF